MDWNSIWAGVAVGITLVGMLFAAVVFLISQNQKVNDAKFSAIDDNYKHLDNKLNELLSNQRDNETKIENSLQRIHERIDEVLDKMENKFVTKNECTVLHDMKRGGVI